MSCKQYRLSKAAEADLLELWIYVLEQTVCERRSAKVISDIVSKFATLAEYPGMGIGREELGAGYRSFMAVSHVIFYRLVTDGIEISRVLHGARDVTTKDLDTIDAADPL